MAGKALLGRLSATSNQRTADAAFRVRGPHFGSNYGLSPMTPPVLPRLQVQFRWQKRILQDSKRRSAMTLSHFFRSACITVVFLLITIVSPVNAIAQTAYFDHSESGRLTRL